MKKLTKALLLVVDVQVGFISEAAQPIVTGIKTLLETARFGSVVFTRFVNSPGSLYVRQLNWDAMQGGLEIEIVPALRPFATVIFDKSTYSALTPHLLAHLDEVQPKRVIVVGLETDACVMQTALGLFDLGYHVQVVEDLVATGAAEDIHTAALGMLKRNIGEHNVITAANL